MKGHMRHFFSYKWEVKCKTHLDLYVNSIYIFKNAMTKAVIQYIYMAQV